MNRIDDFFNRNLTDYRESENHWNVPDDTLWENAKIHFPKKEKKKRYLFWLFPGLLLVGMLLLILHGQHHPSANKNQYELAQSSSDGYKKSNSNSGPKRVNAIEQKTSLQDIETDVSFKHANQSVDTEKFQKVSNEVIDSYSPINGSSTKVFVEDDVQNYTLKNVVTEKKISTASPSEAKTLSNATLLKKQSIVGSGLDDNLQTKQNANLEILSIASIDFNRKLSPLLNENTFNIGEDHLVKLDRRLRPRTEIGLSHHFLFVRLLDGVDLAIEPEDEIIFQSDYVNINFNVRHWISPRWSVQTGMFASKIDAKGNFNVGFEATEDEIEFLANTEFEQVLSNGFSTSDAPLSVNVLEEGAIEVGDQIRLDGQIGIQLNALQLPIFVHHHWNKRRLEFFTGGGVTLEYLWGAQSAGQFNLQVNGEPLDVMIMQDEVPDQYFDASIYLEGGIRFRLTDHINLGWTLRVAAIQPIFSGLDVGVNYRFY